MKQKHAFVTFLIMFFLQMFLTDTGAYAQDNVYLYLKDKTRVEISVGETPKLTYGNDYVRIKSSTLDLEYAMSEIERISFDANYNDIEELEEGYENYIGIQDNDLLFRGFPATSLVSVYTLSGQKHAIYTIDETSCLSVPLDDFSAGTYLFTINNLSYKLIKK